MNTSNLTIELVEPSSVRLQKLKADVKFWLLGKLSRALVSARENSDLDAVRAFCCFVGHGRSGGTLVGALLNAHPNIIVANELNALRHLHHGLTSTQLYRLIGIISSRQAKRGSPGGGGYNYPVPGQWQGRHQELHVVGDRKAGATAYEIVRNPSVLATLEAKVSQRKVFIHVFRNPFDTIATTIRYSLAKRRENASAHLSREIRNYFARCSAVRSIEQRFGTQSIYHLAHERLISQPTVELQNVCNFLGVEAAEDYLKDCSSIIRSTPHRTRNALVWSTEHVSMIKTEMQHFPFLEEYVRDVH